MPPFLARERLVDLFALFDEAGGPLIGCSRVALECTLSASTFGYYVSLGRVIVSQTSGLRQLVVLSAKRLER